MSVLLPFVATEFYRRLVEGIEGVLLEQRYDLALFPILSLARLKRYLENTTLAYLTDGLILASYDLTERFEEGRLPTERPVVLVDAQNPATTPSTWTTAWGRLAGAYLARFPGPIFAIAVEEEPDRAFRRTVFAERMAGFQEALKEAGRPFSPTGSTSPATPRRGAPRPPPLPGEGLPAPQRLRRGGPGGPRGPGRSGKARPHPGRDVRVLGFDGHPFAEEAGLSTIAQPVEAMGARAAQLLLERMRGYQGPPREVRFEPVLVERASTGTARRPLRAVN